MSECQCSRIKWGVTTAAGEIDDGEPLLYSADQLEAQLQQAWSGLARPEKIIAAINKKQKIPSVPTAIKF